MMRPPIPSSLSDRECRLLQDVACGRRVLELGALLGFSTIVLAEVAAAVVSVDLHEGYGPSTWAQYLSNLERYATPARVLPVRSDAVTWAGTSADLAFVDLTGGYALTRAVLKRLTAPFALVHDMGRPYCDVERAARDAGWVPIAQVDTLVWLRRR